LFAVIFFVVIVNMFKQYLCSGVSIIHAYNWLMSAIFNFCYDNWGSFLNYFYRPVTFLLVKLNSLNQKI